MADWSSPQLSSTYTVFRQALNDRLVDSALMFDSASTSATNIPSGAKRWNSTSSKFEKYNGSTWSDLSSLYAINISGNAATATTLTASPTLSGNVGIGRTASASYSLDTSGNARIDDTEISSNTVKLSYTGTGNRYSLIDFKSCDTWADYSTRIIRNAGENGSFSITQRGTGPIKFLTQDGAEIHFWIGSSAKAKIDSHGITIFKENTGNGEGGQLILEKSDVTTLSADTVIDVTSSAVRFFENGGTFRGCYILLSRCATGVGSELALRSDIAAYAAPLASPTFIGTPAAPTAAAGTNTTQIATTAFVLANSSAKLQEHGAVGSFCLCARTMTSGETYSPGSTYTGSTLYPATSGDSGAIIKSATALSGTWKLFGYATYNSDQHTCLGFFQRIS